MESLKSPLKIFHLLIINHAPEKISKHLPDPIKDFLLTLKVKERAYSLNIT